MDVWHKYLTASSLKDILKRVNGQIIVDFIKYSHFIIVSCSICYSYFIAAKEPQN